MTWEKAGYEPGDVFAEIDNYVINTAKNNFTVDSAKLTHKVYFKTPVRGVLSDQAISIRNKETANFPRFETYMNEFRLDNVYKGVNYEGGLAIEGASIKGTGTKEMPAKVTLYRNDTLYLKLSSVEYHLYQNRYGQRRDSNDTLPRQGFNLPFQPGLFLFGRSKTREPLQGKQSCFQKSLFRFFP